MASNQTQTRGKDHVETEKLSSVRNTVSSMFQLVPSFLLAAPHFSRSLREVGTRTGATEGLVHAAGGWPTSPAREHSARSSTSLCQENKWAPRKAGSFDVLRLNSNGT